jgi:TIR domain
MIFERGDFDRSIIQESFINESLNEVRSFNVKTAYSSKPTIFLSHKHDDLKDLQGVMGKLQELGAQIYIDSMDNKMPYQTSGDTALRIKEVIKYCNKFVLLATDKAIESYWCNWELGIGDTYKYIDHIAILPMKEKGTYDHNYKGNEYLQIYPAINYEDGTNKYGNGKVIPEGYYVCMPINKEGVRRITPIKDWINEK